jgi:hypothetical protein
MCEIVDRKQQQQTRRVTDGGRGDSFPPRGQWAGSQTLLSVGARQRLPQRRFKRASREGVTHSGLSLRRGPLRSYAPRPSASARLMDGELWRDRGEAFGEGGHHPLQGTIDICAQLPSGAA